MSKQDIAEFEEQLKKVCEFWRERLTHCQLVGTLDTVKMIYHVETINSFNERPVPAVPAPISKALAREAAANALGGSPVPVG